MCLEMTVFTLQCVWRLMFPWFFLFCKLVSVSLQTTAVMWPRALTDSLRLCCSSNSSQYFHTSPQTTLPCTHQSHSSSLVASFLFPLSFLFSFLSLSPSVRVSAPPSHLLPFSPSPWGLCALLSRAEAPRPLCPALWLAERKPHGWKEWAAPAPLSAQLFGCSNGITLQLQWEESRGRERHSERGERRRAQNGHG